MDNRDAVGILLDEAGSVAGGNVTPAGVQLRHQVVVGNGLEHGVIAPASVRQLDELEVVVVIQEGHASLVDLLAHFIQHGQELGKALRIHRAVLLRHVGHDQELYADGGVVGNDLVQIVHHLVKGDVGADGHQTHLVQNFLYLLRGNAVQTCQLHAVIAQRLHLLHDRLEVFGSVLQKISQSIDLNCYRKFLAHNDSSLSDCDSLAAVMLIGCLSTFSLCGNAFRNRILTQTG